MRFSFRGRDHGAGEVWYLLYQNAAQPISGVSFATGSGVPGRRLPPGSLGMATWSLGKPGIMYCVLIRDDSLPTEFRAQMLV